MKIVISTFFAFTASTAFAQAPNAVEKIAPDGDFVKMVGVEDLPIPPPKVVMDRMRRTAGAKADDGVSTIENYPEIVRQFYNNVDFAKSLAVAPPEQVQTGSGASTMARGPIVYKDISALKLGFEPAVVSKGELIAASPQGTLVGDTWTGMERFYRVEGIGHIRLSENDMKLSGGMFYMLKSQVNTSVGGKPAIAKIFTDDDGRVVEEILWVSGSKLYTLTYGPDMVNGRTGKAKTNVHVSAISLAQELR